MNKKYIWKTVFIADHENIGAALNSITEQSDWEIVCLLQRPKMATEVILRIERPVEPIPNPDLNESYRWEQFGRIPFSLPTEVKKVLRRAGIITKEGRISERYYPRESNCLAPILGASLCNSCKDDRMSPIFCPKW